MKVRMWEKRKESRETRTQSFKRNISCNTSDPTFFSFFERVCEGECTKRLKKKYHSYSLKDHHITFHTDYKLLSGISSCNYFIPQRRKLAHT